MDRKVGKILLGTGFVAMWVAALAFSVNAAMRYESTPGQGASRRPSFETDLDHEWTCVMVAHPQCPCTTVSLRSLRSIMAKHTSRVACRIVFAGKRPPEASANMDLADSIPGAKIEWMSADEAERTYHTYTSGQTFVYSRTGKLVFSGGITPGRGVDQPRYGLDLFESILNGRLLGSETPVFGCPLGDAKK